ncbi:TPA: hypothetical protein ACH3X2_005881 [Trebouxia sp. C0005]
MCTSVMLSRSFSLVQNLRRSGWSSGQSPDTPERESNPEVGTKYDEPEAAVLLVACGIGLATGAGVVVFNNVIHEIRSSLWHSTPSDATSWAYWARDLPISARWNSLLLPPVLGGLAVGLLRKVSGGFDNPPNEQQQQQHPQISSTSTTAASSSEQKPQNNNPAATTSRASSARTQERLASAPSTSSADTDFDIVSRLSSSQEASTSGSSTLWSLPWVTSGSSSLKRRLLRVIRPLLKAAAAAITLGTGNSLGPEGPSVEIGRTAARGLGNVLKSKQRRLLSLVAAGSGAGVAAGFNAPISGVFFAVETVLQAQGSDLRRNSAETTPGLTIAMVLLASVLAAIVSQAGLGQAPAVRVPDYQLQSILELPLILGFGACCGAVSASFAYSNQVTADLFQRIEQQGVPTPLMPAIGGLVTGLMALQYPEVLYQGFGNVNAILQNRDHFAPLLLFQILAVKILCTSVSKGSGLVGGAYAPSIFMGATLGSAFGGTASLLMTPMGIPVAAPQAYALVGVAAMLAANCQVPLTSVLLLFELTQDYSIILPTLAAVGISYWVASLPAASSAFTPSQFQESDSKSGGSIEDSGYMDALQITSQLGLDVAGEVELPEADGFEAKSNGAAGPVERREVVKIGSNGSRREVAIDPAYRGGAASAASRTPVLNSMDSSPDVLEGASVACALEEACVLLTVDTSMTEALNVMDEVGQKVALVTNDEGAVVGVLTRESIVKQLAKGPNSTIQKMAE